MTTRYVGVGGNDSNDGLSWANRKLTLNGAEDTPVVAGDTVYVGPGVYRELLTVDVSGTAGNIITYIADVTGEHTDSVGGVVRISGSNDDQTYTRNQCIYASAQRNYRTFRGLHLGEVVAQQGALVAVSPTYWVIEDCVIEAGYATGIGISGAAQSNVTIRRCLLRTSQNRTTIDIGHTATLNDIGHVVESCVVIGGNAGTGIGVTRVGGVTVRNCTVLSTAAGIKVSVALAGGQVLTAVNNVVHACSTALQATTTAEFAESYNLLSQCQTDRTNVTAGTGSVSYPWVPDNPRLLSGLVLDGWTPFGSSEWSYARAVAGGTAATDDFFGRTRPATASKQSWGAVQWPDASRSSTQAHAGTYSLKLADAGIVRLARVPVTNASTVFGVYVYREADYAGTAPTLIVRQPGQSDATATDAAAAGQWNQVTVTTTPAASPPWVDVLLQSSNTATSSSYAVYADDLSVT